MNRRAYLALCGAAATNGCFGLTRNVEFGAADVECTGDTVAGTSNSGSGDEWPMHLYDAQNTGYNPDATGPQACPEREWVFTADEQIRDSVVLSDGILYALDYHGTLYAIDAHTGKGRWQADFVTGEGLALHGTDAYVASSSGVLYAFDTVERRERWQFEFEGAVGGVTVTDTGIYLSSYDGILYAVDSQTGTQKWRFESVGGSEDGEFSEPVAVADGSVYVASKDGNMYVLDAASGDEQWRFEADRYIKTAPTVANETVYTSGQACPIYALDAEDGSEQWVADIDTGMTSSPAIADGTMYVTAGSSIQNLDLNAIDLETGEIQWSRGIGNIAAGLVVANETVFVGNLHSGFTAVDTVSGETRWTMDVNGGYYTSPAIGNGFIYTTNSDKTVHAIR